MSALNDKSHTWVGRVIAQDAQRVLIQTETAQIEVEYSDALCIGAWVRVQEYVRENKTLRHVSERLSEPNSAFPQTAGDWWWAQKDGRKHWQALHARAQALRYLRSFFDSQGFLEVETPARVPCPGLDTHLQAFEVVDSSSQRWLITSPEYQMKRLLCAGFSTIYQICKAFRKDEVGVLHQPEFTMLEWYRAFAEPEAIMNDTEALVYGLAACLNPEHKKLKTPTGTWIDVTPPWPTLTVEQAFAQYANTCLTDVPNDETFFRILAEQIEPQLGQPKATWLTHYPARFASLARLNRQNSQVSDRFEAYVGGIELCNGFGELTDPQEQRQRLLRDQEERRACNAPVYPLDEKFLAALEEGLPPSSGNALGVDRLIMLALGAPSIADVIAFDNTRL